MALCKATQLLTCQNVTTICSPGGCWQRAAEATEARRLAAALSRSRGRLWSTHRPRQAPLCACSDRGCFPGAVLPGGMFSCFLLPSSGDDRSHGPGRCLHAYGTPPQLCSALRLTRGHENAKVAVHTDAQSLVPHSITMAGAWRAARASQMQGMTDEGILRAVTSLQHDAVGTSGRGCGQLRTSGERLPAKAPPSASATSFRAGLRASHQQASAAARYKQVRWRRWPLGCCCKNCRSAEQLARCQATSTRCVDW